MPIRSASNGTGFDFAFDLTAFQGSAYFSAAWQGGGAALWRVDGQDDQASMVWSQLAGDEISFVDNLTAIGDQLFFSVGRQDSSELWKSDGTSEGTVRVAELPVRYIGSFTDVGGTLFFVTGHEESEQPRLWKSDGTAEGTIILNESFLSADDVPGPRRLTDFNGILYFAADTASGRAELWRSDGTPEGTHLFMEIGPDRLNGVPGYGLSSESHNMAVMGDTLYFSANDGAAGYELWATDGTQEGTRMVADVVPGAASSFPMSLTPAHGFVFFVAAKADSLNPERAELWRSDGTAEGTFQVADVGVGSLEYTGRTLYFAGLIGTEPSRLWSSDGTVQGTAPVFGSGGTDPQWPQLYAVADGRLFFSGYDAEHGHEMWFLSLESGDLNHDLRVDRGDLAILVHHFGSSAAAAVQQADLNADGRIDLEDVLALSHRFPDSVGAAPSPSAAVVRAEPKILGSPDQAVAGQLKVGNSSRSMSLRARRMLSDAASDEVHRDGLLSARGTTHRRHSLRLGADEK